MSRTQQKFLKWFEEEQSKGLKQISFYPGDVSQCTVDDFIEELFTIDKAIADGRYSPFPESF
jgi:hypothetical protein